MRVIDVKLSKRNKLVYRVGINDANYNVYECEVVDGKWKTVWRCPCYMKWCDMLKRCYSTKNLEQNPTYKGCTVCNEWLTFSNFKAWMEKQDWKGKALDKDLLVEGNKVYSPENCVFISAIVNSFIIDSGSIRGELPIGVCLHKRSGKFQSNCKDPFKTRNHYRGIFSTPEEAHLAWKTRKHQYATELANSEYVTDERVRQVLLNKYLPMIDKALHS